MKYINFILISHTDSKSVAQAVTESYLPGIQHYVVVKAEGLQREELIAKLRWLRRRHPNAKILGVEEVGKYQVQVREEMNALRWALSL